jgi:hypothetical protein
MCEQKFIEFDKQVKANTSDNRKTGVSFICFEDPLMNYSSNLRFSTSTSNCRNLQQAIKMGDYGGVLDPERTLHGILEIKEYALSQSLVDPDCIDAIIKKKYGFDEGVTLLIKLEEICVAALFAGTQIRIMNGQFIGKL